jgi:hypothetical protein
MHLYATGCFQLNSVYVALKWAGRHVARGEPVTRRPAGGHPAALSLAEKALVAIIRQRLEVPRTVLAELFGVSIRTIATAQRQLRPLLERAGHTTGPAVARLATMGDLAAYAASHGITLTPKIKPAH